jgi:hypothetical protein
MFWHMLCRRISLGRCGYSGAMALLRNASTKCLKDLDASSAAAAANKLKGATIDYTDHGQQHFESTEGLQRVRLVRWHENRVACRRP